MTNTDTKMDIDSELATLDRAALVPTMVTELTRKGVKRPLHTIVDSFDDERKAKLGRFMETKAQELAMNLTDTEVKQVEQKVDVAVNGKPKTIDFTLCATAAAIPSQYCTTDLGDGKVFFISRSDGLIDDDRHWSSVTKETPFPLVIKIKNNVTNQKKAARIRKLVESGHTARAFLARRSWHHGEGEGDEKWPILKLAFGRTVKEDLKYLPAFEKEKEEAKKRRDANAQAQAFHARVRDTTQPVAQAEFESRLTPQKLEEWNGKMRELMSTFVGWDNYWCFNVDTWLVK